MTAIFEGQPPKTRSFPTKTRVIWVPGIYIYTYTHRLVGYVDHLYEFDMFCRLQSRQIPGAYVLKVSSCAHLATAVQKAGLDRCW